jgi:hypothetical protein
VCITCTQRDSCQYYDPNRTFCAPVKVIDYGQFSGPLKQPTVDWQHYRIQAAIAALDIVKGAYNIHDDVEQLVQHAVRIADALIKELKGGDK